MKEIWCERFYSFFDEVECIPDNSQLCIDCKNPNKQKTSPPAIKQTHNTEPATPLPRANSKYGKRSYPTSKALSQLSEANRGSIYWLAEQIRLLKSKKYNSEMGLNLSEDKQKSRLEHFEFLIKLALQGFDLYRYDARRPQFDIKTFEHHLKSLKDNKKERAKKLRDFEEVMTILSKYEKPGRISSIGSFCAGYDETSKEDTLFIAVQEAIKQYIGMRDMSSLEKHLLHNGVSLNGKKSAAPSWWIIFDRQIKFTVKNLVDIGYSEIEACKIMARLLNFNHPDIFEGLTPEAVKDRYSGIKNDARSHKRNKNVPMVKDDYADFLVSLDPDLSN